MTVVRKASPLQAVNREVATPVRRLVRRDLVICAELCDGLLEIATAQADPSSTCEAHFAPEAAERLAAVFGVFKQGLETPDEVDARTCRLNR